MQFVIESGRDLCSTYKNPVREAPTRFTIVALNSIAADDVDLPGTLALIEEHFSAVARSVSAGEFALWVGSGISRERAPDLGCLITDVIEFLRSKSVAGDPDDPHRKTLERILRDVAKLPNARVATLEMDTPFTAWPDHEDIKSALWGGYSAMLNMRVPGIPESDYLLWDAVDVRAKYGYLDDPDVEHIAIAMLILEGSVTQIASGNWDGLIEVAVDKLSVTGRVGVLRTVVNPEDVRDQQASATLLKFHGCAVACVTDHTAFRRFLVGAERDIIDWPNTDDPMRREVVRMATNHRALVVGLSLQDGNLKDVFSRAKRVQPWRWAAPPEAQAHVFCEDELGLPQRTVLEVIYGEAFDEHEADILGRALLRARPRTALPALALHVVGEKLEALVARCVAAMDAADLASLVEGIHVLRDLTAAAAPADRKQLAAFLTRAIAHWSRAMSLFRWGEVPDPRSRAYLSVSPIGKVAMMVDQNVRGSGLDEAATALGIIGRLVGSAQATVLPAFGDATNGACEVTATYDGAAPRRLTFVGSAEAALRLGADGAFDDNDAIFVHSGDAYVRTALNSARSPSSGKTRKGAKHVSIRQLINEGLDMAMLEQRFLEEAGL